jgi:ornithine cyclodeaminase/alanine dehydrogenase-like protein (mu-crystallin family)
MILTRADAASVMDLEDWLQAVAHGFRAAGEGKALSVPPMHIPVPGGGFHAKGASLSSGRSYVAVKLNGNFPGNLAERGLPTIQGALLLCDGETGSLLAMMDSIEITLRRTAAATALAALHLARTDSETILLCGCGDQAAAQLAALRAVLPLRRCLAWDKDPERAEAFARRSIAVETSAVADLAQAAGESDVIVTCTTARQPFLERSFVKPGTFVAAIGADSPDKSEIRPDLMRGALIVADSIEQCAAMGDLRHALAAGAVRREDVHAELSELVLGTKIGRSSADEITLFDSTGTALQDVASAAAIYERALGRPGILSTSLGAL